MGYGILMHNSGGGLYPDELTAEPEHVLSPYLAGVKDRDDPVSGTMPDKSGTELVVPTNGRVQIPKGYHNGTNYARNEQAIMAGGSYAALPSGRTIPCAGKLMTGNIVQEPYADYSYLLNNQTVFNEGSWGPLASAGLSSKGGGVVETWNDITNNHRAITRGRAILAKSIDLTPYRKIRFFWASREANCGFFPMLLPISNTAHDPNGGAEKGWNFLEYCNNNRVEDWNPYHKPDWYIGVGVTSERDISKYNGQYFVAMSIQTVDVGILAIYLLK